MSVISNKSIDGENKLRLNEISISFMPAKSDKNVLSVTALAKPYLHTVLNDWHCIVIYSHMAATIS